MTEEKYEHCSNCGGKIIDDEPSFIPLSEDEVLKITDQICTNCKAHIVGKYQKLETIKNRKLADAALAYCKAVVQHHRA